MTDPQTSNTSHGRGGAGNFPSKSTPAEPTDLSTPTIKSQNYTTGRGGQGNMAKFDAQTARVAQDVEAPAHHEKEAKGTFHWGRGGQGNQVTISGPNTDEDRSKSKERKARPEDANGRRGSFNTAVDKAKEMLGLGKGSKDADSEKPEAPNET